MLALRVPSEPVEEAREGVDAVPALLLLERQLLRHHIVGDGCLVHVQGTRESTVALGGPADDGSGLAVPVPVFESLQGGENAIVLRGVHTLDPPAKRAEDRL